MNFIDISVWGVRITDCGQRHRRPASRAGATTRARAVVGGHGPVGVVAHLVARRDVEAVLRLERLEALARVARAEERLHHPRHQRLALADRDEVGEGRERLGVQEHRRAAQDHERVARAAVLRPAAGCPRGAASGARGGSRSRRRPRRRRRRSRAAASRSRSSRAGCPSARARRVSTSSGRKARSQTTSVVRVEQLVDALEARGSTSRRSRGSGRRAPRGTTRARHVSRHTSASRRRRGVPGGVRDIGGDPYSRRIGHGLAGAFDGRLLSAAASSSSCRWSVDAAGDEGRDASRRRRSGSASGPRSPPPDGARRP